MKKDHLFRTMIWVFMGCASLLANARAQTILSGDHVVEGNLGVGTSLQRGGLSITGETGNLATPGISLTGDGGVVFQGTIGVGAIPATGPGARMMWYPGKAAFRVGGLSLPNDGYWDDYFIGINSVAFGEAIGYGLMSVAMNHGMVWGNYSTVMSGGFAVYDHSTAMGDGIARDTLNNTHRARSA